MIKRLSQSRYAKNILALSAGGGIAQLITILTIPLLTRFFSPHVFGELSIIQSYAALIASCAFLGFEQALPMAKNKDDKNNLLSLISVVFIGFLVLLGIFITINSIYEIFPIDAESFYLWPLIGITTAIIAMNQFAIQASIHTGFFKRQAISHIIYVISRLALTMLLLIIIGNIALLTGFITAFICSAGYIFYHLRKADFFTGFSLNTEGALNALQAYKGFCIYNMPSGFMNLFLVSFPILYMGHHYDTVIIGFIGVVYRLMVAPLSLVNKSIGQVFYNRLVQVSEETGTLRFFLRNLMVLGVSLPGFIIIMIFGEEILGLLLGEEWSAAGKVAAIMAPYIFLSFCISPLSSIFMVYKRNDVFFLINVLFVICLLGYYNLIFDQSSNAYIFLQHYTLIMVLYYVIILITMIFILKRR